MSEVRQTKRGEGEGERQKQKNSPGEYIRILRVKPLRELFHHSINFLSFTGQPEAGEVVSELSGRKFIVRVRVTPTYGEEVLDAQNWTRWRVRPGASFCAMRLFRDGLDQGYVRVNASLARQ